MIRYYWAEYLSQHRNDFSGKGLEIGGTATIRYYGGSRLIQTDGMDLSKHSRDITVVGDLTRADHIEGDQYDCILLQFTTNVIYDIDAAIYHAVRMLRPGGVLIANFWCTDYYFHSGLDMGTGEPLYMYWYFTPIMVANIICRASLGAGDFQLETFGNMLARTAFLMNIPASALTPEERDYRDPGQPLLICTRIVKPACWMGQKPPYREPLWRPASPAMAIGRETGHYGNAYSANTRNQG